MSESQRAAYDEVFRGEELGNHDLHIGKWPRTRFEASVFFAPGGHRVFDVGCGNGLVLYNLRRKYEELHGIELSPIRSEIARKTLQGLPASVRLGSIEERQDYPDGFFDTIILSDVLEHLVNVWAATEEITRLLRPGGALVVSTPNIAFLPRRLMLLTGRFPATASPDEGFSLRTPAELLDGGHLHYFTFRMMRKLLARYRYSTIRCFGYGRLGRLHNLWPSLLSGSCMVFAKK